MSWLLSREPVAVSVAVRTLPVRPHASTAGEPPRGGRRHAAVGIPYSQTPETSNSSVMAERLPGRESIDGSSLSTMTSDVEMPHGV